MRSSGSSTRWMWAVGATVVVAGALTGGGFALAASQSSHGASASDKSRAEALIEQQHKAANQAGQIQLARTTMASALSISPTSGSSGVGLGGPVTVKTTFGTINSVKVTSSSGAVVAGSLDASHNTWVSTGSFDAATTYSVHATAVGPDGITASRSSSFSTLTPAGLIETTVFPETGDTVGVGQPIVLKFDQAITATAAQAGIVSRLAVEMSDPVPGGWYWFSDQELHFRPDNFWPAHEQVELTGNLNGWNAGGGYWGSGSIADSFNIGDSRISYANLVTETMNVTLNGQTVMTYPISAGRLEYPTMNGDHIVLDKEPVVHMVSSTVGIPVNSANGYDEMVYNDVHISDSGEYVHAAPWSVGDQGHENVSHGCINLSSANSLLFYNFSEVGDVVEVTGSVRAPAYGDHGVMDWSTPWADWMPGNVIQLPGTTAPTTTVPASPDTTAPPLSVEPANFTVGDENSPDTTVAPTTTTTATTTTVAPPTTLAPPTTVPKTTVPKTTTTVPTSPPTLAPTTTSPTTTSPPTTKAPT